MKPQEAGQSLDAVIVLANLMDRYGELNHESSARAAKAVEAFMESRAKFLVTCGWAYREDSDLTIADALCRHIVNCFPTVPQGSILIERNSRDTVGDAYFTKIRLANPRRWKNVLIVTSGYHVPRTRDIFEFIYGPQMKVDVLGADVPHDEGVLKNELKSLDAFRSTFEGVRPGDDEGALKALRERHPFYNGSVHSQI